METLEIILIKYLLGFGLQSFAVVLGIYVFNRQKVIVKNYIVTSSFLTILSYLVRLLPITVGVHTIINILYTYLICVIILKMPAYKTIRSTSLCVAIILLCEMVVTTTVMTLIGKDQFKSIIGDSLQRTYIGVIANVVFALVIIVTYFILKKKGDHHRNISAQDS